MWFKMEFPDSWFLHYDFFYYINWKNFDLPSLEATVTTVMEVSNNFKVIGDIWAPKLMCWLKRKAIQPLSRITKSLAIVLQHFWSLCFAIISVNGPTLWHFGAQYFIDFVFFLDFLPSTILSPRDYRRFCCDCSDNLEDPVIMVGLPKSENRIFASLKSLFHWSVAFSIVLQYIWGSTNDLGPEMGYYF